MFYVVQLDSDIFKEKIVVPSIWIDKYDTLCLLPPITDVTEIEKLAKAQSTPKHGWQMHSVSFIQSFDTYSQAKQNIIKSKPVMIKLEEEEKEQCHQEVRGKRKRKLPEFLKHYSIEFDDDKQIDHGSTLDNSSMEDNLVLDPLIVKIETIEDFNTPENHQQLQLNITHNKSSSTVHSSLQHDSRLQVTGSGSSTMKTMNFAIVKFITEDDCVAIISSNWITDDRNSCRYPNSPNVERLLKKGIKPNHDWKMYPIEIMREFDTFIGAQEHLTKTKDASNLDCEPDERSSMTPSILSISSTSSISSSLTSIQSISSIPSISSSSHPTEHSASSYPIASLTPEMDNAVAIGQLQSTLADLVSEVRMMGRKLDRVLQNNPISGDDFCEREMMLVRMLPMSTLEEFDRLEEYLKETDFHKLLVKVLITLGGRDCKTSIYNILRRLMTSQLATNFSFTGKLPKNREKEKKRAFCSTLLCKTIQVSIRKMYPERKDDLIKNYVSLWLQQAKHREDRRGENKERTSSEQNGEF